MSQNQFIVKDPIGHQKYSQELEGQHENVMTMERFSKPLKKFVDFYRLTWYLDPLTPQQKSGYQTRQTD